MHMRKITDSILKDINKIGSRIGCARNYVLDDHVCGGRRFTREHVWIYEGRQINELWAIIPLCSKAHSVDLYQDRGILNKEINEWISINNATDEDLEKYPKKDWTTRRRYLNGKYGEYPVDKKYIQELSYLLK